MARNRSKGASGGDQVGTGEADGAEHTKDRRPSTENKHEEGEAAKAPSRGGEGGDARRWPGRKPHPGHKGRLHRIRISHFQNAANKASAPIMTPEEKAKALFDRADAESRKDEPDKKLAARLMREAADMGHPMASYALGTWYLHGYGEAIDCDFVRAVDCLKRAANAGIPDACYDLAVCYSEGEEIKKNDATAFEYYLRAALRGEEVSVNSVGTCYFYGIGVLEDRRVAAIWHDRAEELGTSRAEDSDVTTEPS